MSRSDPSDESDLGGPALFGRMESALTGLSTGPVGTGGSIKRRRIEDVAPLRTASRSS